MWHVSSRSGEATSRTAIHLLRTYLPHGKGNFRCHTWACHACTVHSCPRSTFSTLFVTGQQRRGLYQSTVATCFGSVRQTNVQFTPSARHDKTVLSRGVVGQGRGGRRPPTFFDMGDASPTPAHFWIDIRVKVSPLLQLVTY